MKVLTCLTKRNCKMFFKDKGLFLGALIAPIILLFLYVTFLGNVYRQSFLASMPEGTPDSLVNGVVGGQLLSSLLAVCCVTVAFCANMLMVCDKVTGAVGDLTISPVKRSTLALSYYLASVLATLMICLTATAICFIYIACVGWYLSAGDVFLILLDVFILVLFGTALSSIVNFFLTSEGQISAVGTIVGASYGFLCGAYMPISQFGDGLQKLMSLLPGTYGTSLIRNHALRGGFGKMEALGWPPEVVESIKDSVDCNLYFFGRPVGMPAMYAVMIGVTAALVGVYVLLHVLKGRKRKTEESK